MREFRRTSEIPASAAALWRYHASPGAFSRLSPSWEAAKLVQELRQLADGERAVIDVAMGPATVRWVARHEQVVPGEGFVDVAERGPFASWRHHHGFVALGPARARLDDRIELTLPFGRLGDAVGWRSVERRLDRMFRYRHDTTRLDLALLAQLPPTPLRVGVTGASGLLGTEVVALFRVAGHDVTRLVRGPATAPDQATWDTASGAVADLDLDVVVHLAGESVAGRWSARRKALIDATRAEATARLVDGLMAWRRPPRVLVCASASGFYGDRGDEELDEASAPAADFLAGVVLRWEAAAARAAARGTRVVSTRLGVVLSPRGGALRALLPAFLAGAGAVMGDGRAWMPWIGLDDAAAVVLRAAVDGRLRGPVNAVAGAVTQREFADAVASALGRPRLLRAPAALLRLALGEAADGMVLSSARVVPRRLAELGHWFRHPDLQASLRHLLGRPVAT